MARARSYEEIRLCEECGQPIERGRGNQSLCRRCEDNLERSKRKKQHTRDSRRKVRQSKGEDW